MLSSSFLACSGVIVVLLVVCVFLGCFPRAAALSDQTQLFVVVESLDNPLYPLGDEFGRVFAERFDF